MVQRPQAHGTPPPTAQRGRGGRTIGPVRAVWSGALVGLVMATLCASAPAGAQTDVSCGRPVKATVVFIGRVTEAIGSTVVYRVTSVPVGEANVDVIEVDYPAVGDVGFLERGCLVPRRRSNLVNGRYRSNVPTAQDICVGEVRTLHADGSAIDTGSFVEIKERLPGIVRTLMIVIVGSLVVLILVGRLFDRPRAYRLRVFVPEASFRDELGRRPSAG